MKKVLEDLAAFTAEAAAFAGQLAPRLEGATLVTLAGELGAGKTTFVKAVAKALGVEEIVNSPTFVLEKIYQLPPRQAFGRLVHIDAYRLERGSALAALGFDEIMRDAGNFVMLEWPERVADRLPTATVSIAITVPARGGRVISYG